MSRFDALTKDEIEALKLLNRAAIFDQFKIYDHVNRMTFYRICRGEWGTAEDVKAVRNGLNSTVKALRVFT